MSTPMEAFAAEVGDRCPVAVVGGGTKADLGGHGDPGAARVRAPAGIRDVRRRELVVVVGAGTTVARLDDELARVGQHCGLGGPPGSTVGGVVASGRSGIHGRGFGPVRDHVLGISAVDAWGRVVNAGGATVKNVSGFDLCRLWTGSLGTLALLGELTLRTRPRWQSDIWVAGAADPQVVDAIVPDATSVLWDGSTVWVHLGGHPGDVEEQCRLLAEAGCDREAQGPPALPPHRRSVDPAALQDPSLRPTGRWVAEIGVGIVHSSSSPEPSPMSRALWDLHHEVKHRFDPTGRLNPGRSPLYGAVPEPAGPDLAGPDPAERGPADPGSAAPGP